MPPCDESWDVLPQARIRMKEGGLQLLLASLEDGNMLVAGLPKIRRTEGGVYIEIPTNAGTANHIVFLGLEIFIPT